MAAETPGQCLPFEASADLSAKQFFGVKIDSNGRIAAAGDGEPIVGVLQDKPAALGRAGAVMVNGRSKVEFGATVASGGPIACDANGAFVPPATGDRVNGFACEGGDAGDIGSAVINVGGCIST